MYLILAWSTSALAVLLDGLGLPRHQHFVAGRCVCRVTHAWQRRASSRLLGDSVGSKRCRTGGVRTALPWAVDEAAGCSLSVCKGRVLQLPRTLDSAISIVLKGKALGLKGQKP
jgi:hypothetical protein